MTPWTMRSSEERGLLNPAFCANVLWHSARGYTGEGAAALSFEESFLILPFVLHRETRESLPTSSRTTLAAWLIDHPLARAGLHARARLMVPFTKEALTFGGSHGFLLLKEGKVHAPVEWKTKVTRSLNGASDEVKACAKRAFFIGNWFAQAGDSSTVLALLGVRP